MNFRFQEPISWYDKNIYLRSSKCSSQKNSRKDVIHSCYILTRALERGGADSALPSCFLWISFEVFVRSPWFFQYLPKNKRRTFWCKNWRRVDFGGLFLSPQSQHFRFSPSWCHDGGVLAPPPVPAGWARPVSRGAAGRWGGGSGRALGGAGRALGGEAAPGQGHG